MRVLLQTKGLAVAGRLAPLDLRLQAGEFIGLIGPNGAGKTTALRAILGLVLSTGHSSLAAMRISERPRHVAYLAQERQLVWPIPVRDLVALGARANPDLRGDGLAIADQTLAQLGLSGFAARAVSSLSGGEKARVLMARALAQQAPLLIADEPCAALDPAQSLAVAKLLRAEAAAGRAVLASLHDLPLAAKYCSRVLVMADGKLVADGPPAEIFSPALMAKVFAIGFERREGPRGPDWSVTELEETQ